MTWTLRGRCERGIERLMERRSVRAQGRRHRGLGRTNPRDRPAGLACAHRSHRPDDPWVHEAVLSTIGAPHLPRSVMSPSTRPSVIDFASRRRTMGATVAEATPAEVGVRFLRSREQDR